jgi:hypothetical protein
MQKETPDWSTKGAEDIPVFLWGARASLLLLIPLILIGRPDISRGHRDEFVA